MKNPRPSPRSLGFERVGRGHAQTVRYLNRELGDFVVAIADIFSVREDWHEQDQANPLVRQYQRTLDLVLRKYPDLATCAVCCCHCRIRFLTDRRNAGRRNLRCPFGCRQHPRRLQSNERSRAYYQTDSGRRKKKRLNGKRSLPVADQRPSTGASSCELGALPNRQLAVLGSPDAVHAVAHQVHPVPPQELLPPLSPPGDQGTLSIGEVVLDETTLLNSPILAYACTLASLIERRLVGRDELVSALLARMRQHSMGGRARREYVLRYLNQHPP